MKVSILIPVHMTTDDDQDYLREAIESALAQTYQDIEIVLVNDDSPKRWTNHRRLIKDSRLRWLVLKDKTGVSAARNYAAFNATGELLLPLDHDDKAEPNAVEKMVATYQQHQGVIYSDLMLFGKDHQKLFKCPDFGCNPLLEDVMMWNSSLFSKADWQKVGGWNESLSYLEDWDLNLRFVENDIEGHHIAEPLFWYRQRADSRMAKLKANQGQWLEAYGTLRSFHVDFFNGRLKNMCCGGAIPAPQGPGPQGKAKQQTIEGDRVNVRYVGAMAGQFFTAGMSTGIRYRVPGIGELLTDSYGAPGVDPRDAPGICTLNRGKDFELVPS